LNLLATILAYKSGEGWFGFDLDGTIAELKDNQGMDVVGKLIDGEATKLLRQYLKEGKRCRIVTARVGQGTDKEKATQTKIVEKWCKKNFRVILPVVANKDQNMIRLFDDRATGVEENTGKIL
jgi:hypothetical protein